MFAAIVADIFVDFIGDHEKVMLGRNSVDDFELGAGPHLAAWVCRRADDDGFTLGRNRSLDRCFRDLKAGCLKWDKLRLHAGGNRAVEMVTVVGFKDQDAIAWLHEPNQRACERHRWLRW